MRIQKLILCIAVLTTSAFGQGSFLSKLFPTTFEVVANTDVSDTSLQPPTPTHPVYYLAVSAGYRDFGHIIAGEKLPKSADIVQVMTKVLASQGYKLATNKTSPTIMIVYTWGTMHPNRPYPGAPYVVINRNQMLTFLGAAKTGIDTGRNATAFPELSPGLTPLSSDASALNEMTDDGLYIISIAAYDFATAQTGAAKLLWRTNISTPSTGHYLPEVIPTMLAVAAPHIGCETAKPFRMDVGDKFKPKVEIGPATVVEEKPKTGE